MTDHETRLQEQLASYAETTRTSPDAWSRVVERAGRRSRRSKPILLVGLAAAVVTIAAVVAARSGSDSPTSVGVLAANKTSAARSFRFTESLGLFDTAQPSHRVESSRGTGEVDLIHGSSHVTRTGTSQASRCSGTPSSTTCSSQNFPQQTEQIVIGSDRWITQVGGLGVGLGGKPWLHFRTPAGRSPSGAVGSVFDPTTVFDTLKAKEAGIRLAGKDTVNGVATDHYLVTSVAPIPSSAMGRVARIHVHTVIDLWVDATHLARRITVNTEVPARTDTTPPTPAQTVEEDLEFSDFGQPVDIKPPPADQVAEPPAAPNGSSWSSCSASSTATTVVCSSGGAVPSSPPPSLSFPPVTLPAPGQQPADPSAARAAVVKAYTEFFTAPPDQALSYVQGIDQAVINAHTQAKAHNPTVTGVGVTVDQVVFTSPTTAAVRFTILIHASPIAPNQIGAAVLDNGIWKLTRATVCADFALGGAHC